MTSEIKKVEKILTQDGYEILIRVDEVCIHPRKNKKTFIRGCVFVVQFSKRFYFMWIPYSLCVNIDPNLCIFLKKDNTLVTDAQFRKHKKGKKKLVSSQKYVSAEIDGKSEGSVEDEKNYTNEQLFTMCFDLQELNSMKRYLPSHGWSFLILTMNNAISQLPLFFHDGGMNYFFQKIRQHVTLKRSHNDADLFVVNSTQHPLKSSLEKSGFEHYYDDVYDEGKWSLFELGSQITRTARTIKRSILGTSTAKRKKPIQTFPHHSHSPSRPQQHSHGAPPPENMTKTSDVPPPSVLQQLEQQIEIVSPTLNEIDGFVMIESYDDLNQDRNAEAQIIEKWALGSKGIRKLTSKKFYSKYYEISTGKLKLSKKKPKIKTELLNDIFYGGIESNDVRRILWPMLLGHYSWTSSRSDREKRRKSRKIKYEQIKSQWTGILSSREQLRNFGIFRNRVIKIEKDVVRTDRSVAGFEDENGSFLRKLNDILISYTFYDFDVGYCQGMNDILSPMLSVMEGESSFHESETFWLFAALMKKIKRNFMKDEENGVGVQLNKLCEVLRVLDFSYYSFLEKHNTTPELFCVFRWILVLFKREFGFVEIQRLWEGLWTRKLELFSEELDVCDEEELMNEDSEEEFSEEDEGEVEEEEEEEDLSKKKKKKRKRKKRALGDDFFLNERRKKMYPGYTGVVFVAYGMLHSKLVKDKLMNNPNIQADEIFRHVIDQSGKFEVNKVLKDAQLAFEKYKRITKKNLEKKNALQDTLRGIESL